MKPDQPLPPRSAAVHTVCMYVYMYECTAVSTTTATPSPDGTCVDPQRQLHLRLTGPVCKCKFHAACAPGAVVSSPPPPRAEAAAPHLDTLHGPRPPPCGDACMAVASPHSTGGPSKCGDLSVCCCTCMESPLQSACKITTRRMFSNDNPVVTYASCMHAWPTATCHGNCMRGPHVAPKAPRPGVRHKRHSPAGVTPAKHWSPLGREIYSQKSSHLLGLGGLLVEHYRYRTSGCCSSSGVESRHT